MEDLKKILSVVSEYTDVPRKNIYRGKSYAEMRARHIMCYLITEGYPHLIYMFAAETDRSTAWIRMQALSMENKIDLDMDMRDIVSDIRKELGLSKLGKVTNAKAISNTKRMFGFDYTESERRMMREQMLDAKRHMTNFCSYGEQPREPGFVSVRVKPKPTYDSWYKTSN